ncbi:MAG: glycosyltransferase [Rhodobacterales bacterium]|nr:glycosyltransferase [Rhodobacterales bacterium]
MASIEQGGFASMASEWVYDRSLLIYAPVPVMLAADGGLLLDDQACNGLKLWADNFRNLIVMFPLSKGPAPANWVPISVVGPNLSRVRIELLPTAYRADQFFWNYSSTRRRIASLIDQADLVGFAIGGLFGDWGAVGCREAFRMGRPYFVWTDRVESDVVRKAARSGPFRHRIRSRLTHRPMAWLERYVIRRASLGLFHGRETYNAYAPFCSNSHVVHDIHLRKSDHISAAQLAEKQANVSDGPLRIAYLGRADEMKGASDWILVLEKLAQSGVNFRAVWHGDGPALQSMRLKVAASGLAEIVNFPGFSRDRKDVFAALQAAHVFLFCHKTKESPRCLIESLVSGTPIIGYEGAFASELIELNHGGQLVPADDTAELARILSELAADRSALAKLIARAAGDGASFDDETVFHHRSRIIAEQLGPLEDIRSTNQR